MRENVFKDFEGMAAITRGRIEIYQILLQIFCKLVDEDWIGHIKNDGFLEFLHIFLKLDKKEMRSGIHLIESYLKSIDSIHVDQIATELSVDRTKIMRATDVIHQNPPYEGLYKNQKNLLEYTKKLNRFYKNSGLELHNQSHEASDYLCVELDFMRQLCIKELQYWHEQKSGMDMVGIEKNFLNKHLGSWIHLFCCDAKNAALTEFYQGALRILDAFISWEKELVNNLFFDLKNENGIES